MNLPQDTTIALYIHVPFCETRCPYCDFNTYAAIEHLMAPYTEALCREMELWDKTLGHPRVATIFLGGGTPSYLGPEYLGRILEEAYRSFDVAPGAEVTAECNPGDLTQERLRELARLPLNRLSIGVQAFHDRLLQILGRRHTATEAEQAYRRAREAGFTNVNLDLMFGLPHQTLKKWENSLRKALELAPEHLSLYCLTVEKGTPLEQWVRTGQVPEPDPDLAADMYVLAEELLEEAGYRHYEISNWALPGQESQHNLTYWRNLPYLGVGPGAHSFLLGRRFSNVSSPQDYVRRVARWWAVGASATREAGPVYPGELGVLEAVSKLLFDRPLKGTASMPPPSGRGTKGILKLVLDAVEIVDKATEMAETMMLGLRLAEGVSLEGFRARFGQGVKEVFGPQVAEPEELGLLEERDGALRLTRRGRLLGNEVFVRFVAPVRA